MFIRSLVSRVIFGQPSSLPTTEDYAVVAFVPGIDPARSVLILAGTTTFGTQAAAEYVCRQDSLADSVAAPRRLPRLDLKPFEALLHVKVVAWSSCDYRFGGSAEAQLQDFTDPRKPACSQSLI